MVSARISFEVESWLLVISARVVRSGWELVSTLLVIEASPKILPRRLLFGKGLEA